MKIINILCNETEGLQYQIEKLDMVVMSGEGRTQGLATMNCD
jgi:hypothetical protein